MKKYNPKAGCQFKTDCTYIKNRFKIENNYPSFLKCSGAPFYIVCKDVLKKDGTYKENYLEWLKTWTNKAKQLEPYFRKLSRGVIFYCVTIFVTILTN